MIEQVFKISKTDEKAIEKVIMDDNVNYIHMVFGKNDGLPKHISNTTVYMTIVRGTLSIALGDQEVHLYEGGTVLKIPIETKMYVMNRHEAVLELIVVKAPAPKA